MKTSLLLKLSLIFFLLFFGCSKENLVGVNKTNTSKGSIALKINKASIPSEVQLLNAQLSRSNYDTLKTSINVIDDSLNVISFEAVPVGGWHLKIDAQNSVGKIIYRGETDVTIIEDETNNVYLTLQPFGSGTGNINIYIQWDSDWLDYNNNPIFTKDINASDVYGIIEPKILYENGVYKMWYTKLFASASADIWYAESSDGINWHTNYNKPVIQPGNAGNWDDYSVCVGGIIYDNGKYKMYYFGFQDQNGKWCIGYAVSDDGINWEKNTEPVLTPSDNEFQILASSVIKVDNNYYMYYSTRNYPYYSICLATSQDGLHWQKYDQNPILKSSETWEGTGIFFPTVIKKDNNFEMVYGNCNQNEWAFGKAVSQDGKIWVKSNSNPFFVSQETYNNWTNKIAYPDYVKINSEYKIYYTGYIGYDEGTVAFITNK